MAKKIINNNVTRKEYSYQLGGVRLSFTLRNDNTDDLVPFESLLKNGLADVSEDIKIFRDRRVSKSRK